MRSAPIAPRRNDEIKHGDRTGLQRGLPQRCRWPAKARHLADDRRHGLCRQFLAAEAMPSIDDRERLVRVRSEKNNGGGALIAVEDAGPGVGT